MHARRDYSLYEEKVVSVSTSRATVDTAITDIQFIYAKVTGSDATVNLYKNLSPEWWEFTNTWLVYDLDDCSSISLKADVSTTVHLYIAGE